MSTEQNKEVLRRVIEEGFDKGNVDALDDCFALVYTEHQFDLPSTLQELKGSIRYLRETFAPFSLKVEDMVADGDKVWARLTGRGTDSKGLMGRPPTGKSFAIAVIDVCRFENGKIVEHWGVPDRFHQLAQLGLLPQPAEQPVAPAR
ncbi:MAG: ester cyclase [Chloroflexota bacterium]